jgi:hypothetical protein
VTIFIRDLFDERLECDCRFRGDDHKLPGPDRQIDRGVFFQVNLLRERARDPNRQAVSPLLNRCFHGDLVDTTSIRSTISYATTLAKQGEKTPSNWPTSSAPKPASASTFRTPFDNHDDLQYKVVQRMMKGDYEWLEGSLVQPLVPTAEQVEEAIRKLANRTPDGLSRPRKQIIG